MAKLTLPYGSGNREDEDDLLNEMITGEPEPRTMPPPVNQPMSTPGRDLGIDLGAQSDRGIGGSSAGGPLGSTPSPMAAPSAQSRSGGSAMQRYGTANIAGAEKVRPGSAGVMRGFNTNEWMGENPQYDAYTTKNTFGKIASRYPAKPSSIPLIMADPEFQEYFPDAEQVSFDKIDFGDGPLDVGEGFNPDDDTGTGWQWDDGGGGGTPSAPASGGQGGSGIMDLINSGEQATNPDALAAIMAQIEALSKGQNPMEEDELNKLLAGI